MHHRVIVALVASVLVGSHGSDLIGALTGIIHLCSLLKQFEGSKVEVHTANRYAPVLHLAYMDAVLQWSCCLHHINCVTFVCRHPTES